MDKKAIDRMAWTIVFLLIFGLVAFLGILAWGFIEIILWLTS